MAKQLFVNIAAGSIGSALVRSLTDMSPVAFPQLVIGDGRDYELYFVDGLGDYATFSGSGAYIPMIAIGACGYPSGGTAVWTFGANSTAALAYNISPAALQTALQGLASIGSGNVTVAGVAGNYYAITFTGTLGSAPQAEITVNFSGLTPASTVEISTLVEGSASPATNEVQLATLALNPITFADDWTPITNGWTGQLSTRTLEVIQAFAVAGGTIEDTFQVTLADPSGVRTTYVKQAASIVCTIINPEAFAGADKPLLATQAALSAAVLGLGNFTREAITSSATGNSNVTRTSTSRHHTAVISITGTAGTRTLSVLTTNSPNSGDTVLLVLNPAAVAGLILEVRNATSGGTLLNTITTTDSGGSHFVALNYTGSAWQLDFSTGTLLAKADNLAGLANVVTSRANLKALFANLSAMKTANFTVTTADDGKYFPVSTAAGAVVATLPAASSVDAGFLLAVQKVDSSTQVVTTSPTTATLSNAGQTMVLLSDATQWIVVLQYDPSLNTPTTGEVILNWSSITGLTGGSTTDLDGQATANGAQAAYSIACLTYGTPRSSYFWQLIPGTDPESSTIIRPDDFDSSTNPQVWKLVLDGSALLPGNVYTASANSTGNTTLTRTAETNIQILTVTGAARTSIVVLDTSSAVSGDLTKLRLNLPATASIVIEVRNATSGGTLLSTLTTDGSGVDAYLEFYFDGTAWQSLFDLMPVA